jgi:hypothetical protein
MKTIAAWVLILGFVGMAIAACSPTAAIDIIREGVQAQAQQQTPTTPDQPDTQPPSGPNDRGQQRDNPTLEQAKISATIARANFEQEQAFSSKDPTIMKGSATDRYYRQMAETNQDLMDSRVTSIKLIGIEWGSATVRGNAAIATTWETWSTTYADGRTLQSRDRNEYSLVFQNDTWKIDGNTHPDNAPGGPPPGSRQV